MTRTDSLIMNMTALLEVTNKKVTLGGGVRGTDFVSGRTVTLPKGEYIVVGEDEDDPKKALIENTKSRDLYTVAKSQIRK